MKLPFTKMQSLGNDFILLDARKLRFKRFHHLSRTLCDRRFGIGADQLLLFYPSKKADFKMRIFNADGGEAEMCGNGIRCLARYIWDAGRRTQKHMAIETLAGIIHLEKKGEFIKVDMGKPILEPEKIPVRINYKLQITNYKIRKDSPLLPRPSSFIINYPLKIKNRTFKITCVSMGNPHAVIVVNNVKSFPVSEYGPLIEHHEMFPNRTNVEFIQILNHTNIIMRVWERGAGETMACGTGASAACVASTLLGLTQRNVTVHLTGGKLFIEWSARDNHVYMTGPAVKVFEGTIDLKEIQNAKCKMQN
jgi:diaminopimelate epimerase